MAYEEIWAPFAVMLMTAVFILPVMYILDAIRRRIDPQTFGRKAMTMFLMSYIIAMAVYPLAIAEEFLPFNSSYATYFLVLLFTIVVYLIVFNRIKED
jgi:phosphatidylglycerophosphate synthase